MIPKRVTLENFLSFGPKTEIHFADDEPLWVLGGPNGIGKSAVFDAMTYCLFAQHRGGVDNADSLIHHGRDRFGVSFEFEFDRAEYRICRNRSPNGPTQSVERKSDGQWKRIAGVDSVNGVKNWVIETLGLNFASFQASVLLRQGEAEAILDAPGKERMTILKSVLGLERFEGLSARIGEATKAAKGELKSLQEKRNSAIEVTSKELAEAEASEQGAARAKVDAIEAQEAAFAGLNQARLWEESEPKRLELERKQSEAAARSAETERIRREFADFRELEEVLPTLRQLVPLRESLVGAEPELTRLRSDCEGAKTERDRLDTESDVAEKRRIELTAIVTNVDREIASHRKEIDRQTKLLLVAEAVAELEATVGAYPASLAEDSEAASAADVDTTEKRDQARMAKSQQDEDLRRAFELREKYQNLAIGVDCSACGQPVTAEHAEKERRAATANAERQLALAQVCEGLFAMATAKAKEAAERRSTLEKKLRARDDLAKQLDGKRRDLEAYGGTSDAVLLKKQIDEWTTAVTAGERAASDAKAELKSLDSRLVGLADELRAATARATDATGKFDTLEKRIDNDRVRIAVLLESLPAERHGTTPVYLAELELAFGKLAVASIAEEHEKLLQDDARQEEWRSQLAGLALQIDAIPRGARRTILDAEAAHTSAKRKSLDAADAWQTARDVLAELRRRTEEFAELCDKLVAAELTARIHTKLHELLGNTGLLRELVRVAEVEIVRFGNDTLQKLSDGDLSLELSQEPRADNTALTLLVRKADSPNPIPVGFLSGSQKFRVALAIALGIGQFASGQTRPLESVIIDEGFGSLDKEGLRAAAEELNRLKRHLKRIILVSHQDEFTDHFPVVIQLNKTPDGVQATTVRR